MNRFQGSTAIVTEARHHHAIIAFVLLAIISGVSADNTVGYSKKNLKLDYQVIYKLYYENLINENVLIINGDVTKLDSVQNTLENEYGRYAQAIEISKIQMTGNDDLINIAELFFPQSRYQFNKTTELLLGKFQLKCLNISSNSLTESFLEVEPHLNLSIAYTKLITSFFSHLRLLKLTANKFRHLNRKNFVLFAGSLSKPSKLETIFLDSNRISSIRHDTFYDLKYLKYVDLSNNWLKIVHPLTFSVFESQLELLNLANNRLRAVFYTPLCKSLDSNASNLTSMVNTNPLPNLKYLYLSGNNDLSCDMGLLWLHHAQETVNLDEFNCYFVSKPSELSNYTNETLTREVIRFSSIKNVNFLQRNSQMPNINVNTHSLDQTSSFSMFRDYSNRWFDWTLLVDKLPVTTPYPYLMSDEKREEIKTGKSQFEKYIDYLNRNDSEKIGKALDDQEKHVFHTWRTSDVVFDCTNKDPNGRDETDSTIIWKTQHGYLSFLDEDLTNTLNSYFDEELGIEDSNPANIKKINSDHQNSFKIFYQMNKLTKIYNNITVKVGQKFGGMTYSNYLVNSDNQLIVTNMRQIVSGPFVCISINEQGIKTYEYDIHVRVGIDEYFIYCLFTAIMTGFIPSIISLVICCICEYKAARDYNIIRHYTCHPTPMTGPTPPNFDFNDWVSNAASYLPNLKIHDTLDQVNKKLRKGIGKASVAVKTLGITSSAYIYSVYEHSTQRWSDIKGYVPTMNVPNFNVGKINLPTLKYPPVSELANRMRTGMGTMFIQVQEFCGTSDLNHTVSIGDLELETNASNAVGGQSYIFDKMDQNQSEKEQQRQTQFQNYYRFLNFLREESRKVNRKLKTIQTNNTIPEYPEIDSNNEQSLATNQLLSVQTNYDQPTTSAQAMAEQTEYADAPTVVALPKLNMIITFSNVNDDIQKIEQLSGSENDEDDDDYDEDDGYRENYFKNNDIQVNLSSPLLATQSNTDIPFIDNENE